MSRYHAKEQQDKSVNLEPPSNNPPSTTHLTMWCEADWETGLQSRYDAVQIDS